MAYKYAGYYRTTDDTPSISGYYIHELEIPLPHSIHVWHIYLRLVVFNGKTWYM